jgi:hypothetical protein
VLDLELYELTEADLFYYLRANYWPDLDYSPDHYDRIDAVTNWGEAVIELKCRRAHYSQMIIEKDKYDALINMADDLDYKAAYVNSTPLGIYIWDITERDIEWSTAILPAKSFGQTLTFTNKVVGYLPISGAIALPYR